MKKLLEKIKTFILKIYRNKHVRAFAIIYLCGLLFFSFAAIGEDFTLPLSGDYVLQTYAFYSQGYKVFWEFIKTGQYPLFDFSNFLGANYLGTQSFYYVFSPLFYLLCLWPESLLYQGIFFHMVFKFALGGFFMYILLKKYFSVSYKMSVVGGLIYAFSGFSLFYLWFHFGDIIAFFPLFVMGIEKCLKERKGWLLAVGTFLCGLGNYFFLVNFIIFGVFYALYRWIYIYGINRKKGYSFKVRYGVLLQGVLYCFVGVMMAGICLLPSLHVVLQTSRNTTSSDYVLQLLAVLFKEPLRIDGQLNLGDFKEFKEILSIDNIKELFKVLFVWEDRQINDMTVTADTNIGYILSNWLFMNTNCWDNIMFDNRRLDNAIGGFFITTPLTMLLIPSVVKVFKSKRPWAIFGVIVCLILPFLPITSHAAFAFTSIYGRWQIWLVVIGIIFIIPTLDKFEYVDRRLITINLVINLALSLVVFAISKESGKYPISHMITIFGQRISGLVLIAIIEMIVMVLVWFVYRFKLFKPGVVKQIMICIVVLEVGASCIITAEQKGYYKWDEYYISQPQFEEMDDMIKEIKKEDKEFYRIMNTEATRSVTNLPSQLNYAGASTFNSTYSFALDTFKNSAKMAYGGTWSMGNHEKRYWLDQYIGTKYHIIDKKDPNNDNPSYHQDKTNYYDGRTNKDEVAQQYRLNIPWSYKLYKEGKYYDVYINENFSSIGYAVDQFISYSNANVTLNDKGIYQGRNNALYYEEMFATTALLKNEDINQITSLLPKIEKKNIVNGQEVITYEKQEEVGYSLKQQQYSSSYLNLYFSPREDVAVKMDDQQDVVRPIYKLSSTDIKKSEISKYLKPNSQFLHTRWIDKGYFGDQLIFKVKDGLSPIASQASDENIAYINLGFKLGPKVLISLYNGDTLVTQDAHMNSNSSLGAYSSEWKSHRGFYVNQPVDKIVIEFIGDTQYNQMFYQYKDGSYGTTSMPIYYSYQNDIEKTQSKIKENQLNNVKYKNNKFTFSSNTKERKIIVTNIPYDEGWTLKTKDDEVEIFVVNGGFIGFVSEENETNYELSYFTPNLKEGIIIFVTGFALLIVLCFVYKNTKVDVLLIQQQLEENYYKNQEKEEEQQLQDFKKKIQNIFKRKEK